MHRLRIYFVSAAILFSTVIPVAAQRRDDHQGQADRRGRDDNRQNYYQGMHDSVRRGDYDRYARDDERRHHHDDGGIGPGKAALIGGAGGAALGAIFGGGLKGTLIGGAAGAGIAAIVDKAVDNKDHHHQR